MDIHNIALVRATNAIPFDGAMRPVSEARFLRKDIYSPLANAIGSLLRKRTQYDLWNDDERAVFHKELKELMPYSSEYNSMVLFSLNGIVPNDINNTFSDKTCAVIEGMGEQIGQAQFISITPTDTAIKGFVHLSDQAILLIEESRYQMLSQEERELLEKAKPQVQIFQGDLKIAVEQALLETGRYHPEVLSLSRVSQGFEESETREETIKTINAIAAQYDIGQDLHFNIITHQVDRKDKIEPVINEHKNFIITDEYYQNQFFAYLFTRLQIDEGLQDRLVKMGTPPYLDALCMKIEECGLDTYQQIVTEYNTMLEQLRETGLLPTPEEIVSSVHSKEPIDLIGLYRENNFQM